MTSILRTTPLSIPRDGLIGEWLLDGDALDTSGNGNNGTATNVTWVDAEKGYVSKVASFDGSSSKIDTSGIYGLSNFSISLWFKAVFVNNNINIIELGRDVSTFDPGLTIRISDTNNLHIEYYNNGTYQINNDYNINQLEYYNLQYIQNNNNVYIYLNGKLIDNITITSSGFNSNAIHIGYDGRDNRFYFNGQIGLVRIYNRALTDQEIQALYLEGQRKLGLGNIAEAYPELFNGCVGYWDFRNGSLVNLIDGTKATNSGVSLTTDHLGNSNSAYSWGTGSEVITTKYSVDNVFTHTVIFKINSDSGSGDQVLLECSNGSTSTNRSFIAVNRGSDGAYLKGSICVFGDDATYSNLATDVDNLINDGNWHVVSWTRDASNNNNIYLDGNLLTTNGSIPSGDITSSFNIQTHFGRYYGETGGFNGNISSIITMNRTLSSDEIKQLHSLLKQKYIYPFDKFTPVSIPKPILHIDGTNDGTTYYDQSGNGYHGTQVGGVTTTQYGLYKEMSFDGVDDYINLGKPVFNGVGDFTFGVILNYNIPPTNGDIVSIRVNSSDVQPNQLILTRTLNDGNIEFAVRDINSNYYSLVTTTPLNGKIHHIFFRRLGSEISIFIDGKKQYSMTATDVDVVDDTSEMRIGCFTKTGDLLNGKIYSVKVWDTSLTDTQIQQLYYSHFVK